jgi:hypothetical protein
METVHLSFRYTEQDYVRAMRAHYASRLRLPFDINNILLVAFVGAYEWELGAQGFGITLLCVSGILALKLVAPFAVIPIITFRSQPKYRDDYSLSFSPQGIHLQTTHIDSDFKWDEYTSALVDEHSFILYCGSQQFTIVPKRVFQDVSQRKSFEQLLVQNVSKVVDKTK